MMNRKLWIAALCLGLTTFVGAGRLSAAAQKQPVGHDEVAAKMLAEGWKPIAAGVYERQRGPNKVEHMGYGREGLTWTVGELNRQLENLMQEYQTFPSEDLAKVIDHLSVKIFNAKRELTSSKSLSSITDAVTGAGCSICYSATADAYYLTSTAGVAAIADASFSNNCGFSGDTYAYAYARATTATGTTNTVTQEDPHTGTSVSSHASATANGVSNCSSSANSYAQSTGLGIAYTTSDTNSLCPAPSNPITNVVISGPTSVSGAICKTVTWTSTVTGGTAPLSYAWTVDGGAVGTSTSTSVSYTFCSSEYASVGLTVSDSAGSSRSASYTTLITITGGGGGGGCFVQTQCP
ncbi:MAG TPA: hypothetical protein VF173_03370 [Thermoanaerobaculia bacterium]|nr:hypothetical protein [Thermoanaerobaculia bacterium]